MHFLLRRKLWFRRHPAGGDQAATGSLDSIFESLTRAKIIPTQRVGITFVFGEHFRCYFYTLLQRIISPYPHPYWVRLWGHGFSPGLKKCHRTLFCPTFGGRPLRIPNFSKKAPPLKGWSYFCLFNTIKIFEDCSKIICTSVNTPTGCSRMHMDSPPA